MCHLSPRLRCAVVALAVVAVGCGRFGNSPAPVKGGERIVVIAQSYTEILWALGAQDHVVAVDYSSTYPPAVRKLPTVGYHRALSAEGILSMKPTLVISDGNIGPDAVVQQLESIGIPMKTFAAKNDSVAGTKALIREMGAFFHKEARAEELCRKLDDGMARAAQVVAQYPDHPRVAVIHFGRASNVYLLVGAPKPGDTGDAGTAGKMVQWAGGALAVTAPGMKRMASPELVAKANPEVILMTEFGYDRLGGQWDQILALPGVGTSDAAKNHRIYRVDEHQLMYLGPDTGDNVIAIAKLIHQQPAR